MGAALKLASTDAHQHRDPASGRWVVKVLPGGQHIGPQDNELIATVLGSCVAACLYDPVLRLGGLNHFMLPEDEAGLWGGASLALRYGNHAMEALINALLARGADRYRLECKLFGAGNVVQGMRGVGDRNAEFVRRYVADEGLRVISEDLGGHRGRRVVFDPETGQVWRRLLKSDAVGELARNEVKLRAAPPLRRETGSIELFDTEDGA